MTSQALIDAIAVTAELCGTTLSAPAQRQLAADLARYPEDQVFGALAKCRRELKYRLTIAEIISRIDDGRPGPDEAWAMLPKGEEETVVWTPEMMAAHSASRHAETDQARRAAFREKYLALVAEAREKCTPPCWHVSIGWDKNGRDAPLTAAILAGRIELDSVRHEMSPNAVAMLEQRQPDPELPPPVKLKLVR